MTKTVSWILAASLAACSSAELAQSAAVAGDRVGTYDGRAVVIAYANGPRFAEQMRKLRDAHNVAEDAGDKARMAALEAQAEEQQRRFHRQAFDGDDIEDVLAVVSEHLAAIRDAAGVARLEKVNLQRPDGVVTVDVTERLVALFEPNEKGRRWAADIQTRPFR
jgi:hypothetical protein